MKAVIYARFSSAKQNEQSIDGQVRVCQSFAKENNLNVIATYVDRAASGTTDRRPEFRRMIRDSASGHFDAIIVYQYDRFARNRRDAMNNKHVLKKNNVRLLSATEPEITDRPSDIFLEGMLDAAAEFFSRDLAQKTTRGMEQSLAKGLSIGGRTPYGFYSEDRRYYIKENEAKIIRIIFEQYANGATVLNILEHLEANQLLYRGKPFKRNTVYDLLNNRRYAGEYINPFNDELITNMFPAIVDKETFEKVQYQRELKRERTKMSPYYIQDRKYILTGKLKCGYCGGNLTGVSGRSRNKDKYRYYVCNTPGCEKESIRKEVIENIAIDQAIEYLNDPLRLNFIVNDLLAKFKEAQASSPIIDLEKERKELSERLQKITASFTDAGPAIRNELNRQANELQKEIHELDREIVKLKFLNNEKLYDKAFLKKWIQDVITKDKNNFYKERAVNYFINAVFAFNNEAIIYLNFDSEEPIRHTDMLKELEENKKIEPKGSTFVHNGGPRRN